MKEEGHGRRETSSPVKHIKHLHRCPSVKMNLSRSASDLPKHRHLPVGQRHSQIQVLEEASVDIE